MKTVKLYLGLLGLVWTVGFISYSAFAADEKSNAKPNRKVVVDPNTQSLDFTGLSLEGELKTPGEFYFQNREQERFDDLTKRRLNFHREMLRDSVQSQ